VLALTARILLTFRGDTLDLLRRTPDANGTIIYPLSRRASIKDIFEGLGLPHTEVSRIILSRQEQTFEKIVLNGEHYEIHPLTSAMPPTMASTLRPIPLASYSFLVDINVGRLAGLLRIAGIDTEAVEPESTDSNTVQRAIDEKRILLTEDKDFGWLVFVSHADSAGVILLRFPGNARRSLVRTIVQLVQEQDERLLAAFVVVQPGYIRIRRKP